MGDPDENEAFRDHFRRCAVTSFLKLCAAQIEKESSESDEDPPSTPGSNSSKVIDSEWISFALEMFNTNYNDDYISSSRSTCSTIMRQEKESIFFKKPEKQESLRPFSFRPYPALPLS